MHKSPRAQHHSSTFHGIDTPLEELEVFCSKQTNVPRHPFQGPNSQLSIDHETWNKLEKEHQTLWDQFPPHVKNLILYQARQRGIDSFVNRRPIVPDKNLPLNTHLLPTSGKILQATSTKRVTLRLFKKTRRMSLVL